MTKEKLLQLRKKIKSKKPKFVSQDTHKRKRIRVRWRKPKGMQSKMRLNKRGYRKSVTTGYGSPKSVHSLDQSGLEIINISSLSNLNEIDKESQGIIISSSVGDKKRFEIVKKAKEAEIKILNIKDLDAYLKKVEEDLKKKKEKKTKKEKEREEKKNKEKKPEEKKEQLSEKVSEEDKKEAEKKEKDKLLTKQEK